MVFASLIMVYDFLRLFLHYRIKLGIESNTIYLAYMTVNVPGSVGVFNSTENVPRYLCACPRRIYFQ